MGHTDSTRPHLKGYTVNEQRFREQAEKLTEMRRTVELLARTLANQELVSETGKDVLRVITDYAYAMNLLDRYDHGTLTIEETTPSATATNGSPPPSSSTSSARTVSSTAPTGASAWPTTLWWP